MTTNFERSKLILDKLVPQIAPRLEDPNVTPDGMVQRRLNQLSAAYGNGLLEAGRDPVDYKFLSTQAAYCYRSLSAHADWLSRALRLRRKKVRDKMLASDPLKVTCIGGGPGSDIMGIMKFLAAEEMSNDVKFTVLDREMAWHNSRDLLLETYAGEFSIEEKSLMFDVSDEKSWPKNWKFTQCDIVTLSFFLSEVWSFNGSGTVSKFLSELITRSQVGTLFVYLDNGGDNFAPLAEAEFNRPDVQLIATDEDTRCLMSYDEQCNVLEDYRARFGQSVKLTGNIASRIWEKI